MDKQDKLEKKIDDLTEVVVFIKDRMATKDDIAEVRGEIGEVKGEIGEVRGEMGGVRGELVEVKNRLTAVEGRVTGLYNRLDDELDKRGVLEARVSKIEKEVF